MTPQNYETVNPTKVLHDLLADVGKILQMVEDLPDNATAMKSLHVAQATMVRPSVVMPNYLTVDLRESIPLKWPGYTYVDWTANYALYFPFLLPAQRTLAAIHTIAANTTGNMDVGIYTEAGARLVSVGSTGIAPVNDDQRHDVANIVLEANTLYYAALACDHTAVSHFVGMDCGFFESGAIAPTFFYAIGVREEAAAFPLPATATFAASLTTVGQQGIPYFVLEFVA